MWLWVVAVVLCASKTEGGRVLAVLPMPVYSHTVPFLPVLRELTHRGHHITLISPFRLEDPPANFTHVTMNFTLADFAVETKKKGLDVSNVRAFKGIWYELIAINGCPEMSTVLAEAVKPFLPDPKSSKFDLVIGEFFFCQETLSALGPLYGAVTASKHPGPMRPQAAYTLGNPTLASYTPHIRLAQTDQMNLLERTWNTFISRLDEVIYNLRFLPKMDQGMRQIFGDDLPFIGDLLRDVALLMTETHFALNYPRPFARNILEIGGIGSKVVSKLPEDLEKYMEESKAGVIYFSWGSHFSSEEMNDTLSALISAFGQVEQRVLFKWHREIPGTPPNVLVRNWFPQNSILGHPKTSLYVSHCGLNSIYEAAYHGVPVVGTPLFVDQPHNALLLRNLGMAEVVFDEQLLDGSSFLSAVRKVIREPRYKKAAQERSAMLRSRPVMEDVMRWLEFVMEFGGDALRPAAAYMPWYSRLQLDVIALCAIILAVPTFLVILILRWLCSFRRTAISSDKKRQ